MVPVVSNFMMTKPFSIDFSMCNPPFYESKAEMLSSATAKQRPAFTACTGSETEMVTTGGEVKFVFRMIDESLVLQDRVQWYTSMLGKFSSVAIVVQQLRDKGVDNYAVTEFVQGSKTRRWGIAWSFNDLRPRVAVSRGLSSLSKALLPFPSEYEITVSISNCLSLHSNYIQLTSSDMSTVGLHLDKILRQLHLKWMWKPTISTGVGFCDKAVWSRAFRRKVVKNQEDMEEDQDIALGFKIHVESGESRLMEDVHTQVTVRWLKGHDSVLFESFCGMVKRKLEESV